jgi:hypothetical protein
MYIYTLTTRSAAMVQLWTCILIALLTASVVPRASAQTYQPAYYSTIGGFQVTQPSPQVATSGNVTLGGNAADGDFATFATLKVDANIGAPVRLYLPLSALAPAGYRAGIVLATASGLANISALSTVTLRTYISVGGVPQLQETKVVRAEVVRALLGAGALPTQLEFLSSKPFSAVEVEFAGVVGLNYTTNIYYAYGVRPGIQTNATGYLSRFATLTDNEYEAASANGLLCVATDVLNAANVVNSDLTDFALLHSTVAVACNPSLKAKLAGVPVAAGVNTGAPAGYYAGFVVGQSSVLDVSLLNSLRLTTYLNGTPQEVKSGIDLLSLTLLPSNKAQVSFATSKAFDAVKIERIGLLTLLDDLEVYYAFGLAPSAFEGMNPVLSNFAGVLPADAYTTSAPQRVSVDVNVTVGIITTRINGQLLEISRVVNPQLAADNTIPTSAATTNYAELNTLGVNLGSLGLLGTVTLTTPLTTQATASLKLKLNGTGKAGNRVGFAVGQGSGLLDLTALQRLTIATYDADNNLIETKSGSSLLGVALLGTSDINRISFLASRDFTYAEITVTSAASVLSNTRVYYAFAEDVPLLSLQTPLPVELTNFNAKWVGNATELRWATASEKNSRYFVVERSTSGESGYQAVGRVAAAGSSTSSRSYQLRDAEASMLGVSTLYYRLRQVDADGSEAFSPVVAVAIGKQAGLAQLEVYPNPAGTAQEARLDFRNLSGGGQLSTYSETGQLVSQALLAESAGRVALPALRAGLYLVVLRDAAGRKVATERLVVNGH